MKIAILGTRGIPNNYGGFEQFAEYLSVNLVELGYDVTVYCPLSHPYKEEKYKGVKRNMKYCPESFIGSAAHFIYDFICLRDAIKCKYDIIFEFGYQSVAISYLLLNFKDSIVITNMDGMEWKRSKWSPIIQKLTKWFEKLALKYSTFIISDNKGIEDYFLQEYQQSSYMIPYAATYVSKTEESTLSLYNLTSNSYFLTIARLEPENNIEIILEAYIKSKSDMPYVIIGNHNTSYGKFLKLKYSHNNIVFLGSIYNKQHLDSLRHNSKCYVHGHSVGGTNPALLEAMAAGAFIFAHGNIFNKDVLNDDAYFFESVDELQDMFLNFNELSLNKKRMIESNKGKIQGRFSFSNIIKEYDQLIKKITR
jgi:glycosyltransferase involved in cell wall biosynthesis